MKNKKILCLIPSLGTGGAERQMVMLIKLMNEHAIKPTVLTYYSEETDYDKSLIVHRISINKKGKIKKVINIIKSILSEKPDVILSFGDTPNIISVLVKILRNKTKIVVSERNTSQNYNLSTKFRFNLYRLAYKIIPNSISQTDFINKNAPFLNNKIKTITNYTDINIFNFEKKDREKKFKIGIFARYHSQKNILLFLEVVSELNKKGHNVEFHWFGNKFFDLNNQATKHSAYYLKCEEKRKQMKLSNVFFNSFVFNVVEEFTKFDAICLPSIYEGFSNTLSEAIACGKPLLVSNVCDNIYFAKEGVNGFLFSPSSKKEMLEAIENMLELNNDELNNFQLNSREIAENLFSKERFINEYLDVLLK
ncbi:glycosyltransferase [Polaribacter atrinae]|uniref:Glycosyl transferase family 1 domain-containing protein n=1 Tax=Polaribacter atrinae TaxID=1333662 RepID=A0A176TCQ4_9FLAO|nr:glycosyltransferase [Polaribacter atrinae]OAD45667.1 hypothetical protein LPB303_05080 [Polaribacter atrinae]